MRQLVSFVDGDTLLYFVSEDGEQVRQVAQIANPGFDVRDVLQLGNVLSEALGLNGHAKPAKRGGPPALPPAPATPAKPAAAKQPKMPGRRRGRGGTLHQLSVEEIIEHVRQHDGILVTEVGNDLLPHLSEAHHRRQVIDNRVRSYFDRCRRTGEQPAIRNALDGDGRARLWVAHSTT